MKRSAILFAFSLGVFCEAQAQPQWCDSLVGGARGVRALPVDLSAAHAGARFFGASLPYSEVDQALAAALDRDDALDPEGIDTMLRTYANALAPNLCAGPAHDDVLPPARVEQIGSVAWIHPGVGNISLPEGTRAVLLDLRNLGSPMNLRQALEAAVAPALVNPVERPSLNVRQHYGLTDEYYSLTNVYLNHVSSVPAGSIPATGTVAPPIVLLTGDAMSSETAEFAGTLRLANRAWIYGRSVFASIAESTWQGIGEEGLAYRTRDLIQAGNRWPDEIAADEAELPPDLEELSNLGDPPPVEAMPPSRPAIQRAFPFQDYQPPTLRLGDVRAALLIAHGTLRVFFPYFSVVGDHIDERVLETLSQAAEVQEDRYRMRDLLRRFGECLHDGHNAVYGVPPAPGVYAMFPEWIDGRPVVRASGYPGLGPGDAIVSIDGQPVEQWLTTEFSRTSAATDGYLFQRAFNQFYLNTVTSSLVELEAPDGTRRELLLEPQPTQAYYDLLASFRHAGWLADLGAPDLYYINLDGNVLGSVVEFRARLGEAQNASGLILDMRGYPGFNHYEADQRLIPTPFQSPFFRYPLRTGPELQDIFEQFTVRNPLSDPSFAGPLVLIVGNRTASAAENFSMMLVGAHRGVVVGRQSAGTNGNITGVQLPGAFQFSFTGMEVLNVDRSTFHGVGILPDVEVPLSAAEFANGIDPELEAAISVLRGR